MIFIDTGVFIARVIKRGQYHDRANRSWRRLEKSSQKVFTSNFVINETLTFLSRCIDQRFAVERGRAIYNSDRLIILRAGLAEEKQALLYFEKYADQGVSFTDCVSFTLMERNHIREAFTFDRHLAQAGFSIWS